MLIRRILPTQQSVADRQLVRGIQVWRCHGPHRSVLIRPAESTLHPQAPHPPHPILHSLLTAGTVRKFFFLAHSHYFAEKTCSPPQLAVYFNGISAPVLLRTVFVDRVLKQPHQENEDSSSSSCVVFTHIQGSIIMNFRIYEHQTIDFSASCRCPGGQITGDDHCLQCLMGTRLSASMWL